MRNEKKTKEQLIGVLESLRQRVAEMEALEAENKQAQKTLRMLEKAVETMQIGVTITDTEGKIIYTNPAEANMHGCAAEELIGKDVRIFSPTKLWRPMSLKQIKEMKRWKRESINIRKDGRTFPVQMMSDVVTDVAGEPIGIVTSCEDITERKRSEEVRLLMKVAEARAKVAEEANQELKIEVAERRRAEVALKESEEWMMTIFESSRDGILVEESEFIIYMNKSYVHLLGYGGPEELIGKHISTIVSPEENERIMEFRRRRLQGEAVPSLYEFKGRRKDGTLIDLEASVSTSTIASKTYIITVARDITERKRIEERLRQSQKMEAIGQLAGGVAHDFNNLLAVIIALSDIVLRELDSLPKLHRKVEEIKKTGERAASLTHQLLAFSRRQVLKPKVLDINAVVVDMYKMLRRLIGENIELVTLLGTAIGRVKVDQSQVEQVILNLVINARDAMPAGGRLVIETTEINLDVAQIKRNFTIEPGLYVMLRVSDTGSGMDAETLSHIFEPFFTTKEQGKGTGLGLSTVYGIIKQSGGYIEAFSKPGQGTTFEIYLPQVEKQIDPIKPRIARTKPSGRIKANEHR